MFKKTKEIEELREQNRILRHNNEMILLRNNALFEVVSEFRGHVQTNQYGSVNNLLNKMRKTLAELDEKLESFNK